MGTSTMTPEQELQLARDIFKSQGATIATPEEAQQDELTTARTIFAENSSEPNRIKSLRNKQYEREDILGDVANRIPNVNPMEVIGGLGQRFESMLASGPSAITQGEDPFEAMGEATTGKRQFEFGDPLVRSWGGPEWLASGAGLAASSFLDPVAIGVRATGRLTSMVGKQGTEKLLTAMWRGGAKKIGKLNEDAADFAVNQDKMQWLDPKVMKGDPFKVGKAFNYTENIVRDVGKKIFKSSSEAWKELEARAPNVKLHPEVVQEVFEKLKKGLVGSGDDAFFNRMVGTGEELADGTTDNGKLGKLLNKAMADGATLDELIMIQKDLRAAGKAGNVSAGYGATLVNDIMGANYEVAKDAVTKSARQHSAEEILKSFGAKYTKKNKRFLWDEGQKGKLLHYFDDENQMAKRSLTSLKELYTRTGLDTRILERNELGLKRANIAHAFKSETAQGGNMSRLAALPSAFAGAAVLQAMGLPKGVSYAGGALLGGYMAMTQTSPRAYAKLSQVPRRVDTFMKTPMARTLSEIISRSAAASSSRQFTGRGFETPTQE